MVVHSQENGGEIELWIVYQRLCRERDCELPMVGWGLKGSGCWLMLGGG